MHELKPHGFGTIAGGNGAACRHMQDEGTWAEGGGIMLVGSSCCLHGSMHAGKEVRRVIMCPV